MFTGLIETLGEIKAIAPLDAGLRLTVSCPPEGSDIVLGESIALNGACMTVVSVETAPDSVTFSVDVSSESLNVTTLGSVLVGQRVNLERAMLPTTRFGGHFVTGHVDGTVTLLEIKPDGVGRCLTFELTSSSAHIASCLLPKGSVALNGISLTINRVDRHIEAPENTRFTVMIIPHTWEQTALPDVTVGDSLNIEADMLVKAIQTQLELMQSSLSTH